MFKTDDDTDGWITGGEILDFFPLGCGKWESKMEVRGGVDWITSTGYITGNFHHLLVQLNVSTTLRTILQENEEVVMLSTSTLPRPVYTDIFGVTFLIIPPNGEPSYTGCLGLMFDRGKLLEPIFGNSHLHSLGAASVYNSSAMKGYGWVYLITLGTATLLGRFQNPKHLFTIGDCAQDPLLAFQGGSETIYELCTSQDNGQWTTKRFVEWYKGPTSFSCDNVYWSSCTQLSRTPVDSFVLYP